MNTPIVDFVKSYKEKNTVRLHMPGHKGKAFLGCEELDITEIDGADVLYSAEGIIKESEKNAASLFSSAATFYSTEGSTLAIKAMLQLVCGGKKGRPLILAARNVHKAFIYAGALIDFDVNWMYPEKASHLCSCVLSADVIERHILESERKPDAVYLTSPDYMGNIADVKGISEVCDRYAIPLLVDNAHGAYLAFLEESLHPIKLGATMCCDSAHKTLPVLTGGAYLHISEKGKAFIPHAEDCLSLYASTSPSYLIMQSLDRCNAYLDDGYRQKLSHTVAMLCRLTEKVNRLGIKAECREPLKVTISPLSFGYSGNELGKMLFEKGICCEFYDEENLVMMFTPENTDEDYDRILQSLSSLVKRETKKVPLPPVLTKGEEKMSLRQAVFSVSEVIPVKDAVGRICASPTVACPPAVPIAVSGELITKETADAFMHYGIDKIRVVSSKYSARG